MAKARISTTVDEDLLRAARDAYPDASDAAVISKGLTALLATHRAAMRDAAYQAYEDHPLDTADEWGDLESFHRAASGS